MGPVQELQLKGFRSGWVTRVPDTDIPDDGFSDVENFELNDRFLPTKCRGHQKYNAVGMAAAPVRGGFKYVRKDGTKYYVFACGGKLYYSVAGSGTFTPYQIDPGGGDEDLTMVTDSDVFIVQYQDALWIVNNKYPIITNGGSLTTSKMIKILGTVASEITVADLPQGAKYLVIHQERIFALGSIDQPNGAYWTLPYQPEVWTPLYGLNYTYVGKDDGENISGGISYQGYLYIGKPRNLYRFMTFGDITEWQSQRVDTTLGWLAHRTVHEFYGHVIYLSPEGVAMFDGNTARLVSEGIRDKMLELPQFQSNIRQWLQTDTAEFELGTVPDSVDVSDAEVKPKTFPAFQPFIDTLTADFEAGEVKEWITTDDDEIKVVPASSGVIASNLNYNSGMAYGENFAQSFELPSGGYVTKISLFKRVGGGGASWNISLKSDSANSPGATIVSKVSSADHASQWVEFDLGGTYYLLPGVRYWIFSPNTGAGEFWYLEAVGTYPDGNAWSTLSGHSGSDFTFKVHGSEPTGDSIFVSQEHDSSCAENTYGWGAFNANDNIIPGASIVYQLGTYDVTGTLWADISGGQIQTITDGEIPTIARKRYSKWRATLVPPEGEVSDFKIEDVSVDSFSTATIDHKYNMASLGHLAATLTGTVTFYTATSDTDLSEANWASATWTVLGGSNTIASTIKRYMRVKWVLTGAAVLTDLMVGTEFISQKNDLGGAPTTWGTFVSSYTLPGGQTLTWWMRSAATEGGLDSEAWVQQTPGALVTVDLDQWIQVSIRMDVDNVSTPPIMDSFQINYYVGDSILPPCAVVWRGNYWLNITSVGQTINNVVFFYNKDGQYWLRRSNKKNNVYFVDDDKLISGTSASDGFVRLNDTSNLDDADQIVSYFVTKNFELMPVVKLFRALFITSKSTVTWLFSHAVDNGSYTDITVPVAAYAETIRKVLSGIVRGRFIKFKVTHSTEDAQFEFHGFRTMWRALRELVVSE